MKEHANIPMYKKQNGWTRVGWRNITKQFNEKFPLAHFTQQQIQSKEKELKENYRIIQDARKNSGAGWNESLCMIIAKPEIWDEMIEENAKVSKFQKKSFPLYENLASLYAGSITTRDLNSTSTEHPPNKRVGPPVKRSHTEQSTQNTIAAFDTIGINFAINGTNPSPQSNGPEVQSAPSINLEDQEGVSGKIRKQSQMPAKIKEFIELRKIQIDDKKKQEDDYCVEKCIDVVDGMEDLTDEQKADANELFQSKMNRQIFMKTKNPNVRLIWLKKKISQNQ
ncbi:hypothetical protein SORBI_3008G140500 [Sorghum bicolor]|nr:hypothetical protein SORBI_3008G140500 [Sorghum bicolor]